MGKHRKDLRARMLEFVEGFVDANGYPPTYDEIREALELSSKSHVDYYLDSLERDGYLERRPRTPRGLRLLGQAPTPFDVPVEGQIAAGEPLELADAPGLEIELTADIADPRQDLYALQVEGNSMVDALVGNGDILIVERREEVERGQMAVVHLQDENAATLKYIYPEGERVRLEPAHPTMPPLYTPAANVQVQGQVVAIIRRY